MDPTLIVLLSFVIFIGVAYRLGYHQSMAALDHKIASIRQDLEEAERAKEGATKALKEERQRHGEIEEEIKRIAKQTEEQAFTLRENALEEIHKMISIRQKAAEDMIERMRHRAIQTIQEEAAAMTLATFEKLVTAQFSSAQQEALNDEAIAQITAQLTKGQMDYAHKPKRFKSKRFAAG
ncbi:MAG: synthase [Alphaproteobacteria bacterium]|jgi:F-type H+-transporting ATPase subunit b|nr:synthase [Alphaproteobacteria bacterium]MDF3034520.1 synthase [Alphaproteobacteria bacterium]